MVCSACKGARHDDCPNHSAYTPTWCDCAHRAPGHRDQVVQWQQDKDGITRKVEIEDVIEKLREPVV